MTSPTPEENGGETLGTRFRRAVMWSSASTVLSQIISWGLTLLTARLLTAQDYGVMALAQVLTPYLALVASLNIGTWIIQEEELPDRAIAAVYGLAVALGAAMSLTGIVAGPALGAFFDNDEMVLPFQVLSATFVVQASSAVPLALLRRDLEFRAISIMNLCNALSTGVLQVVLAWQGFGYWALAIGIVARVGIAGVWAHLHVGWPAGVTWDNAVNRQVIRFGLPATGAILAAVAFNSSDKIVIGRLFDVEFLGFYTLAFTLSDMPLARINDAIRPAFLPYFSRLRSDPERMREQFSAFTLAVTSVIFPVLLGLASVAERAIPLLLGAKWVAAVVPLQVMCVVGIARAFIDNIPHLLLALGKPVQVLRFRLVFLAVMPVSFLAAALIAKEPGIYAVWLVVFPLLSLVALSALRRETGIRIRDYATNLVPPTVSAVLMLAAVRGLDRIVPEDAPAVAVLVAEILAGGLAYAGAYFVLFPARARKLLQLARARGAQPV